MTAVRTALPNAGVQRWTLDGTFAAVAPHLSPSLVSPAALGRILALTRQLPASLSRFAYLECRLAPVDPTVDVIFDINEDGRRILAGQNPLFDLPSSWLEHPAWLSIRKLCRGLTDPTNPIFGAVRSIWLEFDLHRGPANPPVPGVFLRFEGGTYSAAPFSEREKATLLCEVLLPSLIDRTLDAAVVTRIRNTLAKLPPGAQLVEAGVMLQRDASSVRLCLRQVADDQLLGYLRSIDWTGDSTALSRTLETFSQPAPHGRSRPIQIGFVDLDVGREVQETIGLEYFMETGWRQLVHGVPEVTWLDRLVDLGLSAPEKRNALLRWPGYSHASFPHELWPSIVVRHFNHVKLGLAPGHPLIAKAYLYFYHCYYKRTLTGHGNEWTPTSSDTSADQQRSS